MITDRTKISENLLARASSAAERWDTATTKEQRTRAITSLHWAVGACVAEAGVRAGTTQDFFGRYQSQLARDVRLGVPVARLWVEGRTIGEIALLANVVAIQGIVDAGEDVQSQVRELIQERVPLGDIAAAIVDLALNDGGVPSDADMRQFLEEIAALRQSGVASHAAVEMVDALAHNRWNMSDDPEIRALVRQVEREHATAGMR